MGVRQGRLPCAARATQACDKDGFGVRQGRLRRAAGTASKCNRGGSDAGWCCWVRSVRRWLKENGEGPFYGTLQEAEGSSPWFSKFSL